MASQGVNPFLMEDLTDYSNSTSQLGGVNISSNPFLSGSDYDIPSSAENPFLASLSGNEIGSAESTSSYTNVSSTNPFATFASDYQETTSNVDFFSSATSEQVPVSDTQNYGNIFSDISSNTQTVTADSFFSDVSAPSDIVSTAPSSATQSKMSSGIDFLNDQMLASDNVGDYCKETSDIFSHAAMSEESSNISKGGPPRRPPPPRPPPSKETKDLILSVTGAMEATSSHLLDRLQATRTPSPTPIRDLHSPSPTPDVSFSDLLGGIDAPDTDTAKFSSFSSNTELNLLGDTEEITPVAPTSPAVPQRPPRPERPPVPPPVSKPVTSNEPMVDLFENKSSHSVAQPDTRNAEILSLFNAPVQSISQTTTQPETMQMDTGPDLLLGDDFNDVGIISESQTVQESSVFGTSPVVEFSTQSRGSFSNVMPESFPDTTQNAFISPTADSLSRNIEDSFSTSVINDSFSPSAMESLQTTVRTEPEGSDDFDAFTARFESVTKDDIHEAPMIASDPFDPFASTAGGGSVGTDAWGAPGDEGEGKSIGFGADEGFDAFLSMSQPPPPTPNIGRGESADSDEGPDLSVFIRPKNTDDENAFDLSSGFVPTLAPPPKSPGQNNTYAESARFNPFDKSNESALGAVPGDAPGAEVIDTTMQRTDSQETPPTPLFDEDVSQPLEEFPRVVYTGDGWEMQLRQPNKKKITGQRFWKKVFMRLVLQGDNPILQLFNTKDDKDPFQELPLQACYSVSDIGAQQYDQYGKIFTVKLQYVFYKERPGIRPGQVTKAERITNKLSQFAAYAIQGDYQGCKEFGSDIKKLGLPVEHAPQISQLFKIGSQTYEDLKQFSVSVEEALFHLSAHRDRALNYKTEEIQITAVDELYVEQDNMGCVEKQIARVRLFFLGFLAGMPDVELGINDMWRQGKEVVGRHDIIPVITEEWIRLENVEFHSCVQTDEYERTHIIKFKPPDACYIELMRFRVRPPKNRELPLQVKTVMCITGNKVELKSDILVPGFTSRKLGQIPCEDVMVRFPIPECWIYLFRVEKHFRYGSVKSAHRRTGKVKGIERFLGAVETLEQSLIEVTSGQAKYEHQHRAIVWRMPRLPKEGQGAYTTHSLVCRMALTSYDQIPEQLADYCYVEFTMPATQVSHTTVRSVSLVNGAKDDPPEKYVRYLARHEYRVGIEHTQGEEPAAYAAAAMTTKPVAAPAAPEPVPEEPAAADSDSDSSN